MMKLMLSILVAFAVVLALGPVMLPLLRKLKFGQIERELGPASHKQKQGTPTMGGIMILAGVVIASLCFGREGAEYLLPTLLVMAAFSVVGFLDDFIKIKKKRNLGLRAYQKIIAQFAIAIIVAIWAYRSPLIGSMLYLPISGRMIDIGAYYIPLVVFVIISEVNAVNLTDGLDGLASSVTMIYALAMTVVFAVIATHANQEGLIVLGANRSAMGVFSAAVAGALLAFLRYNAYPAKVFMGDTGSLALGGAVSMMAILSQSLILLPIMGLCFVASALSVILQVATNKLNHGKRMFKMAPLHHHFELSGYAEPYIVTMYSIVTAVLCGICLLSYFR